MKFLVTGGLGFVGGRLTSLLAQMANCELTIGTRRTTPPPSWAPHAKIATMDWQRQESLDQACLGQDVVVHLATANAATCMKDPVKALDTNGVGTARLVRAAATAKVARFVYLSTIHVYGSALEGAIDENVCPRPTHPYPISQRVGEDMVRLTHAAGELRAVVVRLSNGFGAPADPSADCWNLFVNDLVRQGVETGKMILKTRGTQRRDFIPMSEICRAIVHLSTTSDLHDSDCVVNVGSGRASTLQEMARRVASRIGHAAGTQPEIVLGESTDTVGEKQFEYRVQRLRDSGFTFRPEAVDEELDRLILSVTKARQR